MSTGYMIQLYDHDTVCTTMAISTQVGVHNATIIPSSINHAGWTACLLQTTQPTNNTMYAQLAMTH